jgi:hypothetical protein
MPSCSRKKTTERSRVAVVPVRPPCAAGFVLGWREGLVPGNSAIGSDHSPLRSRPAKRVRRRVRIAGESGCRVAAAVSNGCRRRRARSEILAHFGAIGLLRRAICACVAAARCDLIQRPSTPAATLCASRAPRSGLQRRRRASRGQTA